MTFKEVKSQFNEYRIALSNYNKVSEKFFPTHDLVLNEPIKATLITKEDIIRIKDLRNIRDQKESAWHDAMIEYYKQKK